MLDLGLDGLASEVREARWERVFERRRQCFDKGSARARRVADAFALMAREKLAGSPSGRLACASASADFGDERGAGLDKNIGAGLVAMENDGARCGGRSEHGAFVAIGAGVGVRLTFQPAAQQNQLRSSIPSRLSSRAMPEDVHSARRAERDNRAAGEFQLRESFLRLSTISPCRRRVPSAACSTPVPRMMRSEPSMKVTEPRSCAAAGIGSSDESTSAMPSKFMRIQIWGIAGTLADDCANLGYLIASRALRSQGHRCCWKLRVDFESPAGIASV